jgi:hypothetical protein
MTTTVLEPTETKPTRADHGHNALETAQRQFDRVAGMLGLDQATRDLLRSPLREYHFSIPIRMDDGSKRVFRGFRVQHKDARGGPARRKDDRSVPRSARRVEAEGRQHARRRVPDRRRSRRSSLP